MSDTDKTWQQVKSEYLKQIEKELARVNHPSTSEIIEDVTNHLDRRYEELTEDQHLWEAYQSIITDMGPASDYAELAEDNPVISKSSNTKLLLKIAIAFVVIVILAAASWYVNAQLHKQLSPQQFADNFTANLEKLDIDKDSRKQVVNIFGEPLEYVWGNQVFKRNKLPMRYVMVYPKDFKVVISKGQIQEIRFEGNGLAYRWHNKIGIGSSLEEVLEVLGQPKETVTGGDIQPRDGVLYKDVKGRKGYCYYQRSYQNIRIFFLDYKVGALYIMRSNNPNP